jgi:PTH1 family peptidyl-tRNA hydrolase
MSGLPIKLIVGLGNPGPEHLLTRHNAGFWFADALARAHAGRWREQRKFQGELAKVRIGLHDVQLLKPLTYMNRSGMAIRAVAEYLRLAPDQILVAHDELDLPPGAVRLKSGGGAGGHNGLRDTITQIGEKFWRLRLGIGHPGDRDQVLDYVLSRAGKDDEAAMLAAVGEAVACIPVLLEEGAEKVMNRLHRKAPAGSAPAES